MAHPLGKCGTWDDADLRTAGEAVWKSQGEPGSGISAETQPTAVGGPLSPGGVQRWQSGTLLRWGAQPCQALAPGARGLVPSSTLKCRFCPQCSWLNAPSLEAFLLHCGRLLHRLDVRGSTMLRQIGGGRVAYGLPGHKRQAVSALEYIAGCGTGHGSAAL